ncbi:MAG: HEAT repeat domain-containing protein [Candidatus Riflebacteria bacterium]|nr:HEAT repeat domain-containing protein [Candidatus Riflebacteria bacterium]
MSGLIELLLEDLASDNRNVRCDALRQLADTPFEEPVRAKLEPHTQDPDPEIQFLARQAVHSYDRRNKTVTTQFPEYSDLDELENELFGRSIREFMNMAIDCPRETVPDMMEVFRRRLPKEKTPARLAAMLGAFRRWGKNEDAEILLPFVRSKDPLLIIEVIGALERHASDRLAEFIPELMGTPSVTVQVRTLRALLRQDFSKGLEYLQFVFSAEDPAVRAAGVMLCMTVPFPRIKELLFNALAVEEDPRVLARSQILLFLNPDTSSVTWLMDVSMGASGEKVEWCKDTIDRVLESIKLSGIMEGSIAEFTAKVRKSIEGRQQNTLLGTLLDELQNPDPLRRHEAIEALRESADNDEVREKFQELYLHETDQRVKGLLTVIFSRNPDRERLQKHLALIPFQKLLPSEQLELLGQIKSVEEFSFVREHLRRLVTSKLDAEVQAEATRILGRFGDESKDLTALMVALRHPEPLVQARAIDGVGRISPESLLKELPRLLRSNEPTLRSAALKAFFKHDKARAMTALQEMLTSDSSAMKESTLICLSQLNYSATRSLLLTFLKNDSNLTLVKKAGVILKMNPDPDAILAIHKIMKFEVGNRRQVLLDILSECVNSAIQSGIITGSAREYILALDNGSC